MTIREFVNAVETNPSLLDLEIGVAIKTKKERGGQFDGAVWVHLSPVESVTIGGEGVLLWANPNSVKRQLYADDLSVWPGMTVLGPIPESLRW
jgi:hypothetical protein